jgi:arylsulfatase A-like enzyme
LTRTARVVFLVPLSILAVLVFYWWNHSRVTQVASEIELSAEQFRCPRCNVIFLNLELLRADHTGLIGGTSYTPNIDRFFRNGIILHDVTSPGGETFLSNTAVQTGIHPHRLDITGLNIDSLERGDMTHYDRIHSQLTQEQSWTEILREHGYHTIGINQGGRAGSGVFLDRGVDDYTQWPKIALLGDMIRQLNHKISNLPQTPAYILFRPTTLHNMQYRLPAVPAWLARLNIVQRPYSYTPPDYNRKRRGFHLKRNTDVSQAAQQRMERQIYRTVLQYADHHMASALDTIDRLLPEDTIVVLYSNHGSGLGDNGIFEHGTGYQASVHVPVFIRHPNIHGPVHVRAPLALFDLVPTVSSWLGASGAEWSMLEPYHETILRGSGPVDREIVGKNSWDEYIRLGDWKLITVRGTRNRLYHIKSDPGETNNLFDKRQAEAATLEARLSAFKADLYERYEIPR